MIVEKWLPPNGKKALEEELMRGREKANQLLEVLTDKSKERSKSEVPFGVAEHLVREVLRSFTNTLLLLSTNDQYPKKGEPPITRISKNGRGSSRRKSTVPTWKKDSSLLIEDGHAWRKYGQKKTTNSKYLRSYYRCTHKYDQGCQAIKHVQRIQDDPPLYRTSYYDHHTCKSSYNNSEIILEPDSSILLNFNNHLPSKKEDPSFSSPLFASTKQEPMEVIHNDHIALNQLSENLLLCDYEIYSNYSRHAHVTMLSSTEYVEFDNVYDRFGS